MDLAQIKEALGLGLGRHYSHATLWDRNRVRWYAVQDFFSGKWYQCESVIARRRTKARGAEFKCGRRMEGYPYAEALAGPDFWRFDGTCNYCGSLSPVQFFKAIEDECEIGPTDKNYKVYIKGENAPKVRGAGQVLFPAPIRGRAEALHRTPESREGQDRVPRAFLHEAVFHQMRVALDAAFLIQSPRGTFYAYKDNDTV